MVRKHLPSLKGYQVIEATIFLLLFALIIYLVYLFLLPDEKVIVGYWYVPEDTVVSYPIPNSYTLNGEIASNEDMQGKINYLDILMYAFLHVNEGGDVHFNDSSIALSPSDAVFCQHNPSICTDRRGRYYPKLGNFDAFVKLQNQKQNLKRIISIGGAGDNNSFDNAVAHMPEFTESIAKILQYYHLDGVDLDFEPTLFQEKAAASYGDLVKALRKKLGKRYIITLTIVASPKINQANWSKISPHVNFISDMCYEFYSPFSKPSYTNLTSNLYFTKPPVGVPFHPSCDDSIRKLISLGVPARKIILGYPSFGVSYGGVKDKHHGLFQPNNPAKTPSLDPDVKLAGAVRYSTILKLLENGFQSYSVVVNNRISATWAYNPKSRELISYDSFDLVLEKARYVVKYDLAGLMTWTVNDDAPVTDNNCLLKAAHTLKYPSKIDLRKASDHRSN